MDQTTYWRTLEEADCLYDHREVEQALDRMAASIEDRLGERNPLVLAIMNGGIVFTGQLVPRLNMPLELAYIHATRYRKKMQGDVLQWLRQPPQSIQGRVVLLLDDILDEGITLKETVEACFKHGAASVQSAVLVRKRHDRNVGFEADYVGLNVPDRFVFGYGMDYQGYLRNAPGIYAVKDL